MFNSALMTGTYPILWKSAEISPIPKTQKPGTYNDFCPISLLYHLSQITEKFMNRELSKYVSIDPDQFAYSQGIGTTDALVKLVTEVASMLDNRSVHSVQSLYLNCSRHLIQCNMTFLQQS